MKNIFILILTVWSLASFGAIHADYSADKYVGCPPLVVNFTDLSISNNATYIWIFDNGNTSSLRNPSATFLTSGVYHVKLIVTTGSQTDSVIKTIRVFRAPNVDFSVDQPSACLNDTVKFLNASTPGDAPIVNYAWGFGNGVASSDSEAHYKYPQTGIYGITLVVRDTNGCTSNKTIPNYVKVSASPLANFNASPAQSCNATQLVSFTNMSSGNGLSYAWSLNDSTSSTLENPTHVYHQEKYAVKLIVTDTNGCKAVMTKQVSAIGLQADFIASKTVACTGEKIQFANTSNFAGTSWLWNFGDGTTSTQLSPQKSYSTPGSYNVSLRIQDGQCVDSILKPTYIHIKSGFAVNAVAFSADSTIACGGPFTVNFTNNSGSIPGLNYHWDFGNGDSSDIENPTNTYTGSGSYTVTLTISDSNGCSITGKMVNYIQTAKPIARFSADTSACPGSLIKFHNSSSNATSYFWQFGDGDTSTNREPQHAYSHYGVYSVSLTAYNPAGCDTTITKVGYIHIDSAHADFNVSSTFSPCPPFVCKLNNKSDYSITRSLWNFGDGFTDTAMNPTHIYFFPGVYSVSLIGYTKLGCTDTITYNNLITVQGPTGNFTVSPKSGCAPLQVRFTGTPSANTKNMWCDLGDGTVLADSTVFTHTYTAEKVYHPQFILIDHVGCQVPYHLDSIVVSGTPQLEVKDTSVCVGTAANIGVNSNAEHFRWTPSTFLQCDTCQNTIINANGSMTYQVSAFNNNGCAAQATVNINVAQLPALKDSFNVNLCKGDAMQLNIGNARNIKWSPALYLSDPSSAQPTCTPQASVNYSITAFNQAGCSASTQVSVTVKDKVDVSLQDDAKVCPNTGLQLQSTLNYGSDLGVQYQWSPSQYLSNADVANPTANLADHTVKFQLIATSGHCIADTQTVNVHVNPLPTMEVSSSVVTTPYAEVPLYAASHEDLTYQWFSKDSMSCTDCRRPNLYPSGSQIVYVEGKDPLGCTVKDSVKIEVTGCDAQSIFMPNTFTPNGDGLNDKFFIRSASLSSLKYFRIFDQWGNIVFQTENLNEGWDGSTAGRMNETGVYVYVLEGKCQNGYDVIKSGNITAIR